MLIQYYSKFMSLLGFTTLSIVLMLEDADSETGQVLQGMDSLPPVLKRYVQEDNRWFQQQLREWEKQLHQASQEEPQIPITQSPTSKEEKTTEPEHPNSEPEKENNHEKPDELTPDAEQEPLKDSEGQLLFQMSYDGWLHLL